MDDDFLHRLRKDPPPEFAARLKARLDAQSARAPSRPDRSYRLSAVSGLLAAGIAFAALAPTVKELAAGFTGRTTTAAVPGALEGQRLHAELDAALAPLAAMSSAATPFDAAVAHRSGERLERLAPRIPDALQRDVAHASLDAGTLAAIRQNWAEFVARAGELQRASRALSAAAAAGDRATSLEAIGRVMQGCQACHAAFGIAG